MPSRALARAVAAALGIVFVCDAAASVGSSGGARPPSAANAGAAAAVFNCADAGTGSLRAAIASAANGDTIDMSGLQCSSISLTTGALQVTVDSLTLIGPAGGLTVNGRKTSPYAQVIKHSGAGTLTVRNMTLQNGRTDGHGGCLESTGNVVLDHATVAHCTAYSFSAGNCPALGGGVYAQDDLTVLDSAVFSNFVGCYSSSPMFKVKMYGGGVFSGGDMAVRRSSISGNYSAASQLTSFAYAYGGGLSLRGNLDISDSTIAQNHAGVTDCFYFTFGIGGGIYVPEPTSSVTIANSTISGNEATVVAGGIITSGPLTLANSTVAFNRNDSGLQLNGHDYAPGVHVQNTNANLQSSIIANNKFSACQENGGYLSDLTGLNATITGADNLIMGSTVAPPGSLTADPLLGALADNGGPTLTHKPGDASPALTKGNNAAGLAFDQRGSGHARSFSGKTDIGAFQTGDSPFNNGFDAPP